MKQKIKLHVNNEIRELKVDFHRALLDVLKIKEGDQK